MTAVLRQPGDLSSPQEASSQLGADAWLAMVREYMNGKQSDWAGNAAPGAAPSASGAALEPLPLGGGAPAAGGESSPTAAAETIAEPDNCKPGRFVDKTEIRAWRPSEAEKDSPLYRHEDPKQRFATFRGVVPAGKTLPLTTHLGHVFEPRRMRLSFTVLGNGPLGQMASAPSRPLAPVNNAAGAVGHGFLSNSIKGAIAPPVLLPLDMVFEFDRGKINRTYDGNLSFTVDVGDGCNPPDLSAWITLKNFNTVQGSIFYFSLHFYYPSA